MTTQMWVLYTEMGKERWTGRDMIAPELVSLYDFKPGSHLAELCWRVVASSLKEAIAATREKFFL